MIVVYDCNELSQVTMVYIIGDIIVSVMINRLVAENTIKAPFKGQPCFSISKKLICFQSDSHLKIKTLTRQAKDIEIPFAHSPLQFSLSQVQPWVLTLTPAHLLQVYLVEYINGISEGSYKKVAILHNVDSYRQNKWGIVVAALDKTLKIISYKQIAERTEVNLNIDCNSLKSLCSLDHPYTLHTHSASDRILLTRCPPEQIQSAKQPVTEIIDRVNHGPKYERYGAVTYLGRVLSVYKERFAFQRKGDQEVEIVDIEESKLVGRFSLEGIIKYSQIRQNLLVIVSCKDNTDYFNFFVLNPQPTSTQPMITNRSCYEKGKGDFVRFYNVHSSQSPLFLQKKKNAEITDHQLQKITDNTSSILYILNKTKEKIQIVKLDHSKLLKSPFGQEKMDLIIYSKKQSTEVKEHKQQNVEIQRSRVHSSIELKIGGESMQEMQKRFVENLIDIKLKNVLKKFQELEHRVMQLENIISGINSKIEQNLQKINRKQIKHKVEQLFDALTPQFQKYFSEIFKQVSGVFEQGVTYYNLKLAKEAEFHKEALTQVVSDTFKFTEEVAQISRKEQSVSERTEEYLRKILESKRKWAKTTEEFEGRAKEVPSPVVKLGGPEAAKPQGKVFVRADLNYQTKKET